MNESENIGILDFRLKSIESEIKELKQFLVSVPIMNSAIDNLEKRVTACETNIDLLNREVAKVKNEPTKRSAEKWQYISEYIFKTIVAFGIGGILLKVGLNDNQTKRQRLSSDSPENRMLCPFLRSNGRNENRKGTDCKADK